MAYETIKIGSVSAEIQKVKQLLKALEYKITSVDPTFDYQSKISLEAFQNDMGISTQDTNMSKTIQKLESFYRQRFPKDDHQLFTTQQATVQSLSPTVVSEEIAPIPLEIKTESNAVPLEVASPDAIASEDSPAISFATVTESIAEELPHKPALDANQIQTTEAPQQLQRKNSLASIEEIDIGIRFDGPPVVQSFFEPEQQTDKNNLAAESLFVHSSSCCYDDYLESVLFNETDLLPQENQPMIASIKKREHIPFENNTNMSSTERLVSAIEKKYANMHFPLKNRCPDL